MAGYGGVWPATVLVRTVAAQIKFRFADCKMVVQPRYVRYLNGEKIYKNI